MIAVSPIEVALHSNGSPRQPNREVVVKRANGRKLTLTTEGHTLRSGRLLQTAGRHLPQRLGLGSVMTDSSDSTNPFGFSPWRVDHPQTMERKKPMSTLSRRTLVTGAAALPAFAVPAVAAGTPTGTPATAADRAKEVVEALRGASTWELDEARAIQFVENVQNLDPDDGAALLPITTWVRDHGQSLDWIFENDAGVMVCRLAARSVAAQSAPDPIFAVIEVHRRLWWSDLDKCSDLDLACSQGDEEAAQKLAEIIEALDAATDALVETVPTTNAGVAALLEYAADHTVKNGANCWPDDYGNGESWVMTLHRRAAEALRIIAEA
jgi:hypothetical protein